MTENPFFQPESITNYTPSVLQTRLEAKLPSGLVQLALKREDLREPIIELLKLINEKTAKNLEAGKSKASKTINLDKLQKTVARTLSGLAVYTNSDPKYTEANGFDQVVGILEKIRLRTGKSS